MKDPQALLDAAVRDGVFPCARAVVIKDGKSVLDVGAGGVGPETIFDLASLTKIVATTPVFLSLWAEGRLSPETRLGALLPGAAARDVSVADLLFHRSGLPAWAPYFAPAFEQWPELARADCRTAVRAAARRKVLDAVLATGAGGERRALYSDVGFILLGEAMWPIDSLFTERVARKLGIGIGFRRIGTSSASTSLGTNVAPTGTTRPREPAPGQEGLWAPLPQEASLPGEVDDDNAFVLEGVAGHAGLFGTAADVVRFGQCVLEELDGAGLIAPAGLWQQAISVDAATPGSTRAMGFETPSPTDSSAGTRIRKAIGHLGFTGTSLWIDLERRLVVALLSNRTFHGRHNVKIRELRPLFHDAVVEYVGG